MLVTNFWIKYVLSRTIRTWYQFIDVGRIHPLRAMALRALDDTADFIEQHMPHAVGFDTQKELLEFALREVRVAGHYMEFGVYRGGTIRRIAKCKPAETIHGFDSFKGLPDNWTGHNLPKGTFSTTGRLPRVPANVNLHRGWFEESLPRWLQENEGSVAFIHNDSDLYSSAVTILELLAPRLQPGTVILFDEFFNYPGWQDHQVKAWREFAEKHGVDFTFIGYARQQAALRVNALGTV